MPRQWLLMLTPVVFGIYQPMCPAPELRPTMPAEDVELAELWKAPVNIADADFFYGSWGREHAPDPADTYRFLRSNTSDNNPGMKVADSAGRQWDVKQASHDRSRALEGPIEVVVSRILSGIGYHQPPVYYLPSFMLRDTFGERIEPGGRFRLHGGSLEDHGSWSWQQNPFVGTRPYNGLLVILIMLNSSDLKNSNNALYEVRTGKERLRWFVVRDLGIALGSTGRVSPPRGDIDAFEEHGFITGVESGFVTFDYRGDHEELIQRRITPDDVRWAGELLGRITYRQWRDVFRAGGFDEDTASRFIARLQLKVTVARNLERSQQDVPVGE